MADRKPRPKRLTAPGVIGRKLYLGEWLLAGLCAARGIGVRDVRSANRDKNIAAVRREFCLLAKQVNIGSVLVARLVGRDHATVLYHQNESYRDRKNAWQSGTRSGWGRLRTEGGNFARMGAQDAAIPDGARF